MEQHILAQLLYLLVLVALTLAANKCPRGWTKDAMSLNTEINCFYFVEAQTTFADAQTACRHVGGALVPPVERMDLPGISNHIQTKVAESSQRNVWVDMVKTGEKEWMSSNNTELLSPINWYEGYPEGEGDCGVLLYSPNSLKNKLCSLKSAFICRASKERARSISKSCSSLEGIMNANSSKVPVGTYHYLTCDPGYVLSSQGHRKTYCKRDGMWNKPTAELAVCEVESCNELSIGSGVNEITDGSDMVGAVRNFTCEGDGMFKSQTKSPYIAVKCNGSGKWVSAEGKVYQTIEECVPIDTEVKDSDPNAAAVIALSSSLSFHSVVTITTLLYCLTVI